ncbi:MAG: tetratricopeptide repeat protein [Planctomycetaceae bacterium]
MSDPDPMSSAAQDWFKKGTDAMNRQNWDFAVECFSSSVKMKPDFVLFRQTKHGCCRKMHGDNGTGARMAGMKLMGIRGKIKKARSNQDWQTVDRLAEEGLVVNPWDAQLYADIGMACSELERGEIAKYALGKACELDQTNIEFLKAFGQVLRERGDYKEARRCFERAYKLDPNDGESRSMMSKLDAESVMDRGGYEKADSTKDVQTEKPAATNAYEEDRRARKGAQKGTIAPGESVEMDLRAAIRKDPNNVALYQKLADVLIASRQLPQAIETLDKALELVPNNEGLKEIREDVELDIIREKVGEAAERLRKFPTRENLKTKYDALKSDLMQREMEVLAGRVESHPNDMKMRFDLAERYRKTQQYAKAIPLLQQAVADMRLSEDALVSLGECFIRSGKADLGRRQFMKALETLNAKDKPDAFKNAHYYLGRLYEKAGKNDEAEKHYNEILGVDYDFRDVLKRLEEIQGGDEFESFDDD